VYGAATVGYLAARFLREKGAHLGYPMRTAREMLHADVQIVGNADVRKNIIPINEVVDLMYGIRDRAHTPNSIYHLVSHEGTTLGLMNQAVNHILHFSGLRLVGQLGKEATPLETELNEFIKDYTAYMLLDDPIFDDAHTRAIMSEYQRTPMTPHLVAFLFRCFFTSYASQLDKRYRLIARMME